MDQRAPLLLMELRVLINQKDNNVKFEVLDFYITSTLRGGTESLTKMGFTFTTSLRRAGSKGDVSEHNKKAKALTAFRLLLILYVSVTIIK